MFEIIIAASALVAASPPEAVSVEDGRVVISTLPHWEPAYKASYKQSLRCRRGGGEAEVSYRLDSRDKGSVFYGIESVTLDGVQQSDAVIERLNDALYSFDEMPRVSLQCWARGWRMAFKHWEDEKLAEEVIVSLDTSDEKDEN